MSNLQPGQIVPILSEYTAIYADPIAVRRGDRLIIGQADTDWPAFVWCTGPDGRSGWMPAQFFEQDTAESGVALRDYSALELSVQADEHVTLVEEAGGWWWVTNATGLSGWVPVERIASDTP